MVTRAGPGTGSEADAKVAGPSEPHARHGDHHGQGFEGRDGAGVVPGNRSRSYHVRDCPEGDKGTARGGVQRVGRDLGVAGKQVVMNSIDLN